VVGAPGFVSCAKVVLKGAKWANEGRLKLLATRVDAREDRRFLVYVVAQSSRRSPLLAIADHTREFDLAVRFYESPGANSLLAEEAEYVMTGGLSKLHSAAAFLKMCNLENRYDGYLFLDGDLEFDASQLGRFLSLARAAKLDLAQPSVTRDSYSYWEMAYNQPNFLFRETSFVEVMAPYMSRNALTRLLQTFARSISSYGLDFVWPSLLDDGKIGVVDAFQIRHADRVDLEGGAFYRYLATLGIDPIEEGRRLLSEYGVRKVHPHSRRGYMTRAASRSSKGAAVISVLLPQVERLTRSQFTIDFAMNLASRGPARTEAELTLALRHFLDAP
jgi:hypothetical protein